MVGIEREDPPAKDLDTSYHGIRVTN